MMKIYRVIYLLLAFAVVNACTKDELYDPFEHSIVENLGSQRVTSFQLPYIPDSTMLNSSVLVIQIGGHYVNRHTADIEVSDDKKMAMVKLELPEDVEIANGEYILRFDALDPRFVAQVSSERMGVLLVEDKMGNNLRGSGTEYDPYIIRNNTDFSKFIYMIANDDYDCAGVFFKQTANIHWANDEAVTGEGLSSQNFSGVYDGGGYSINDLMINGKSGAGIFTKLGNGARIENLDLHNLKFVNGSSMGSVAGVVEGTVVLKKIDISGEISGTKDIGGVVGIVKGVDGKGVLSVEDVTIGASVSGTESVGGVAGSLQNGAVLNLKGVKVSDSYLVGDERSDDLKAVNVGGLVGYVSNSVFEIASCEVIHTTKVDDNTIVVSGKSNVGGIIGKISSLSANSSIGSTRVISPVLAESYVGGFVGFAQLDKTLSISGCQYGGIIKQGSYIGGYIGSLEGAGGEVEVLEFRDNDVVASNGSDILIRGEEYVGGVFGAVKGVSISFAGENNFGTKVSGSNYVGGIAGYISETKFDIGSPAYANDGEGVIGLKIEGESYVGGAVGYMESSTLMSDQRLDLASSIPSKSPDGMKIICTIVADGSNVGGAVGRAEKSSIKGLSVNATITNKADDGVYTGGIAGLFHDGDKTIEYCSFYGIIAAYNYTGGIVGEINKSGEICQCVNYASIKAGKYAGGIVGKINNSDDEPNLNICVNVGTIKGEQFVGGIVGYISAGGDEGKDWMKVSYCGNFGDVTASSSGGGCVGGIVGKCDSDKIRVNNGANHGNVMGLGSFKGIGGIAGSLGKDAAVLHELDNVHVYQCANTGSIGSDCEGESHIGGIVGYLEEGDSGSKDTNSQVNDCYNGGKIGPSQGATRGGLIGHCDYYTSLRRCINYGDTGGGKSMIGTVVTAGIVHDSDLYHLEGSGEKEGRNWSSKSFNEDQMSDLATFENFSADVWTIGKQMNMGEAEPRNRAILAECPFQNIVEPL